jgi:transposase
VFCERLHPSIAAYARRTTRLEQYLQNLALQIGGEKAAFLLKLLNINLVSADTLLNLSRKGVTTTAPAPKVVGIDEWAIHKGRTYATILVDLETRTPIDLLADAKVETVEAWLKEHPGIEVISRDRDTVFAQAASKGAPSAIQVADRWHLLQNLGDTMKRMLEMNPLGLKAATNGAPDEQEVITHLQQGEENKAVTNSELRHKQVKDLQAKGWAIKRIARYLKMHRQTVKKYMQLEKLPKKRYLGVGGKSSLTKEQIQYLSKRWAEGDANAKQLWHELKGQGYQGAASSIYRAVAHFAPRTSVSDPKPNNRKDIPPLSARSAMWLMVKPASKLSEPKRQLLTCLLSHHGQAKIAYPFVQSFVDMVKNRKVEKLDNWVVGAKESGVAQLKQFAGGLQRDYQAVHAALSMEWSNGQVEGQINRLKLIKRQGFGRAKLDLLKKRVLYRSTKQAA